MNKKAAFFIEILWLVFGITALILGFVNGYKTGYGNSKMIFIVSIVSFLMYFLRRYMRKTQKQNDNKS